MTVNTQLSQFVSLEGFKNAAGLPPKKLSENFFGAIRLDPNNAYAHAGYAQTLIELNDRDLATNHLEKAIQLAADDDAEIQEHLERIMDML